MRAAAILISILSLTAVLSCKHKSDVERPVAISYADFVRQLPDSLRRSGDTLAYPNPFSPDTRITYDVKDSNLVTVELFNVLGQVVALLVNERQGPGKYELPIPDVAPDGRPIPNGMYLVRITAGSFKMTKKLMILKREKASD